MIAIIIITIITSSSSSATELIASLVNEEGMHAAVVAYMKSLIRDRLTNKMLEIVDELHVLGGNFPQRAGSYLPLSNPALEFVKATTHIMGLDRALTHEVSALRRLLLTQLRVREFSPNSVFQDPCLSYVLRDVICSYCSTCRDMDLLRDESVTCEEPSLRWHCAHCHNKISTEEVENRLLDATDKITAAYLLQDFRCARTHMVSRRLATAVSDLSTPLLMDTCRVDVVDQLRVLRQVAHFHDFKLLASTVEELLV
mmetsp:Transcript_5321/g.8679  ORF Transcript_5321/g.8679 Transcript_5321/m.8679 type:complete len:256 (+) Transcript_5321:2682-3449(+)